MLGWAQRHSQGLPSTHMLDRSGRGRVPHPPPGSVPTARMRQLAAPQVQVGLSSDKADARAKGQKGSKHFILFFFSSFLIKLNSKTKIHKLPPCPRPPPSPARSLRHWFPLLHPTHRDTGHPTEKTKLL
uniref:Uncharacterized protein n=1 Tax=Nomascus leucogenys TaxID=61853 RepID=A0A2I3HNB9_NOMLE